MVADASELQQLRNRVVELEKENKQLVGELDIRRQDTEIPNPNTDTPFCTKDSTVERMIQLPHVCRVVCDTLPFQRLRDLLQLGGVYWVYATTHHKRFDHCLGTASLAFQLVTHLALKQPELKITRRDIVAVTLAALCHDLGHGPLSHAWDNMVMPMLYELEKERREVAKLPPPPEPLKHEEISVLLFRYIADEIRETLVEEGLLLEGPESDLTFICELINPAKSSAENWQFRGRPQEKAFLWEIVSNKRSGIDVDRLDYIRRDCYHAGVTRVLDIDRIIHHAHVRTSSDNLLSICWPKKEMDNLFELFHMRDFLHRDLYQHPVGKVVESMVSEAMMALYPAMTIDGQCSPLTLYEACFDPCAFIRLSDWIMQLLLHGRHIHIDWEHSGALRASELVNDVFHRNLWRTLGEFTVDAASPQDIVRWRDEIFALLPLHVSEQISIDYLLLRTHTFSYGMDDKNPIQEALFDTEVCPIQESHKMLPASFCEVQLRCILKSSDQRLFASAKVAFNTWCNRRLVASPY